MKTLLSILLCAISYCASAQIPEPGRSLPLLDDVDIVVVGGGVAATAAALEAKAAGASVFLVMPRQNPADDLVSTRRLHFNPDDENPAAEPLLDSVFPIESEIDFSYRPSIDAVDPHSDEKLSVLKDGVYNDATANSAQYGTKDSPCDSVVFTVTVASGGRITAVNLHYYVGNSDDYGRFATSGISVSTNGVTVAGALSSFGTGANRTHRFEFSSPLEAGAEFDITAQTSEGCVRQLVGEIVVEGEGVSFAPAVPAKLFKKIDSALMEAGVAYFTGAQVCDVLRDSSGRVSGVVVANRSGRQAIKAKAVIDATEWGDVVRKAALLRSGETAQTAFTHIITVSEDEAVDFPDGYSVKELTPLVRSVAVTPSDLRPSGAPSAYKTKTYAVTGIFPFAQTDYLLVNGIAQKIRNDLWRKSLADQSEKPFFVPPESIKSSLPAPVDVWTTSKDIPLEAFHPHESADVWVVGMLADVERSIAERLSLPVISSSIARRIAREAVNAARSRGEAGAVTCGVASHDFKEVREPCRRPIGIGTGDGTVEYLGGVLPIIDEVDVVVVGGGTAGAPAAIAAAQEGKDVLLLEWLYSLGGTMTEGRIGRYWYGNERGFTGQIDAGTKGNAAIGWVFNIAKGEWLRKRALESGAEIIFGAFVSGAYIEGRDDAGRDRVRGVVVVLPDGRRGIVKASAVVDASGNADVAAAAGADTMFLSPVEFAMQGSAASYHVVGESYRNTDVGFLNTPDAGDLFFFALRARLGLPSSAWNLSHVNVGARERRRIVGDYIVTAADIMINRRYPDTIMHGKSNFDMHGFTTSPLMMYCNHTKNHTYNADLPYRALIPEKLDGIFATGLSVSAHRDAMPILRMQPDVQNQGYAAGLAAAAACDAGSVRGVDVKALQRKLVDAGCLEARVLDDTETVYSAQTATNAVESLDVDFHTFAYIVAYPRQTLPILQSEFKTAEDGSNHRKALACALLLLGDDSGFDVVAQAFAVSDISKGFNFKGLGNFGRQTSGFDLLLYTLAQSGNPRAAAVIARRVPEFVASDSSGTILSMSHFRMASLSAASLRSHRIASQFVNLAKRNANILGWEQSGKVNAVSYSSENAMDVERMRTIRELAVLNARYRFGDSDAARGLEAYLSDTRTIYASWAETALAQAKLGEGIGFWEDADTLVIDLGTPLNPSQIKGTVHIVDGKIELRGSKEVIASAPDDYKFIADGSFEPINGDLSNSSLAIAARDKRGDAATGLFSGSWKFSKDTAGVAADGSYFMEENMASLRKKDESAGKHAAFIARRKDNNKGGVISQTFAIDRKDHYQLAFYMCSRYYNSYYNAQVIVRLDGKELLVFPQDEPKIVKDWTLIEVPLGLLEAGEHVLEFVSPSDNIERWTMIDLVRIGEMKEEERYDDFGKRFSELYLNVGEGGTIELSLDELVPVRLGGLKIGGTRLGGLLNSDSSPEINGTGALNVPARIPVSIRLR